MYLVQEFQKENGHISVLSYEFDNMKDAIEKYHEILKFAIKSNNERHGAVIFDEYFEVVKREVYDH